MSEERLKEIKDSIELQTIYIKKHNFTSTLVDEEADLYNEVIRLRGIINELEKLELYTAEEDYDYEENPIDKYVPFDVEDYIKELEVARNE